MMSIITHSAIFGITLYQRLLSPYKGYRCAHAALHQGSSCSQAIKLIIAEKGVWRSRSLVKQRFAECRAAALEMRRRYEDEDHQCNDSKKHKDKQRRDNCLDYCDLPCDCIHLDCNPCG